MNLTACIVRTLTRPECSTKCLKAGEAGPEGIIVRLCAFAWSDAITSLQRQKMNNADKEKKQVHTSRVVMMGVHCDWHSGEIEDGAIPARASKPEPGCLRTT